MRTTTTIQADRPTVRDLRAAIDDRIKAEGRGTRTSELRRVGMSATTLERILREGLSRDPRKSTEVKLRKLGVLDLIPRR